MTPQLPGDSEDYHLLTKGIELSQKVEGITCEIGLRRGGGTKYIIDALAVYSHLKKHIAIDPYGNIDYEHKEAEIVKLDYTNQMKLEGVGNCYLYAASKFIDFDFYPLEDTVFFELFKGGVPIYNQVKRLENKYSFVHFDGPHAHLPLLTEINFFKDRTPVGGCWVFDDVTGYYDHDAIEEHILSLGFILIEKTNRKALYQKATVYEKKGYQSFENKN
jgi:hypothetical protein